MTAKIDTLTILEAQERDGALKRLVREVIVIGLSSSITDWKILTEALDEAGVPACGSFLTESTSDNAYEMVLVERNPTMLDKGQCKIQLVYESTFDREQDLDDPRGGIVLGEVRCTIQQKSTNRDSEGEQVTVQHTYPADDPNHPGELIIQGGEFQYYEAQRSVFIRGIKITKQPWLIANSITGRVNSIVWSGADPRYWMCTACSWRPAWSGSSARLSNNNRYYMDFEFQYNEDTWDSPVVFTDDVTGKPPPDLIADVGYKTIEKLRDADFEDIIGAVLLGG